VFAFRPEKVFDFPRNARSASTGIGVRTDRNTHRPPVDHAPAGVRDRLLYPALYGRPRLTDLVAWVRVGLQDPVAPALAAARPQEAAPRATRG